MFRTALGAMTSSASILTAIKAAHTFVWAFFVASILAIWVFAWRAEFFNAALAIGVVFVEVAVLVVNGLRCPLTSLAARYTEYRGANFDIYLPEWLARHNQLTFGALYAAGIIFTLARWAVATP
jgi:hypothetical protein